jgi:hypothetical protein
VPTLTGRDRALVAEHALGVGLAVTVGPARRCCWAE